MGEYAALADMVSAEIAFEGFGHDVLMPFEPIPLVDVSLKHICCASP